jgi:predicted enzyme related to lactoylglutathione lyase
LTPIGGRKGLAVRLKTAIIIAAVLLGADCGGSMAEAAPAPIVFFDIAGPDLAAQGAFYKAVFGWEIAPGGRFSVPVVSPLPATLRADPPQKIIYLGVDDVGASLAAVVAHGGRIVQPRFEVKGVVVLGLFTDPAGNAMGLVEMKDGKPKIP